MSFNFNYKIISKPVDDICAELLSVKKLRARHELLCRTLASWKLNLEQNTSQLNILDETAEILNGRHRLVANILAAKSEDPILLSRLQREIHAMELQVEMWVRELSEVSTDRKKLELENAIEFSHQKRRLQRSVTNVELAKMDADFLERKHRKAWREFLEGKDGKEEELENKN